MRLSPSIPNSITETTKQPSKKTLNEIAKIQKRLKTLTPVSPKNTQLKVIKQTSSHGHYWLNVPEEKVLRQITQYQIMNIVNKQNYRSDAHTVVSYLNKPIQVTKLYQTTAKMKLAQLAVVQYLCIATETGYTKQDVVLLKPNQ